MTQNYCRSGKQEQREGVPKPPGQAMLDDVADIAAAGGDAGHRRDVVGFQRMLHAEQKAESQNSEHPSSKVSRTRSKLPGHRQPDSQRFNRMQYAVHDAVRTHLRPVPAEDLQPENKLRTANRT